MDNINLPHAAVADLAYHEEIEQCHHAIVNDLANDDNNDIEEQEPNANVVNLVNNDHEQIEEQPHANVVDLVVNNNGSQGEVENQDELDDEACEEMNCQKALLVSA